MNSLSLKITLTICILTTFFFSSIESSRSLDPQEEEDLVTRVCKKTQYYDLCMSLLFQDTRKYECDTKGLAKLVMEKDQSVAKEILDALQNLTRDEGQTPVVRQKCGKCFGEYKAIVFTLMPNAYKAIDSGKLGDAIQVLKSIANYAKACDDEFSKGGGDEPFVNQSVHQISMLAANIVELVT